MNENITIFLIVAAIVTGGVVYFIRTIRLVRSEQPEQLDLSGGDLKTGMPVSDVPPDVVKAFQGLSVSISANAAPALAAVGEAMKGATKAFAAIGQAFERKLDSKAWNLSKLYFDKHDLYVGCYWKLTDNDDLLIDILDVYLVFFGIVWHLTRVRQWAIVPRKFSDPVCVACGLPHSLHPTSDAMQDEFQVVDGKTERIPEKWCEGKFIL